MRPIGTAEQLANRRQQALKMLDGGQGPSEVARRFGVTPQSVCRWRREAQRPPRTHPGRPPGRPARLSAAQMRRLETALKRGAFAAGYAEDYWTLDRVAHLIWERFQIRFRPNSVWYVLQRLGWSSQKPQRRAMQRDDEAVARWKRYHWPRIKKVA